MRLYICELENGLLVIADNDNLYSSDPYTLSTVRRVITDCEGPVSNTKLEIVHNYKRLEEKTMEMTSVLEVSANILMTQSPTQGIYKFWDVSDLSVDPQLVYAITDGINRGPALRLRHSQPTYGTYGGLLVFEGTMQLWDWSTKRFINTPLIKAVNTKKWDSSIVELKNGSIVLHSSDESAVLWRFPNRSV